MGEPRYRRLTGTDTFFIRQDQGAAYNHTVKITILDPTTDPEGWSFDTYRKLLEQHLAVLPVLRQRYVPTPWGIHHPVWVDDPAFDFDSHVRRVACPAPGGMKEFCKLVEQVYSHPLDHQRPLWQVWAVEGLRDGRVAIVALLHHAYADGAGIRGFLEQVAPTEPGDSPGGGVPEWTPSPLPSAGRRLAWALRELPARARAIPTLSEAVRERRRRERAFQSTHRVDRPSGKDRRAPQLFGGALVRSRRFSCDSFALPEMQEIRAALGGTLNDVFLSCVAGSIRSFAMNRGLACDSPVVATMAFLAKPLDQRPAPGGNYSSGDDLWLHVDIADPKQRFAATIASAGVVKDHIRAMVDADPFSVLPDLLPGGLMQWMGRFDERTEGRFTPVRNVILSNASGPREPRYVGRWLVEHWFSAGQVLHGATVNMTGWSYAGRFEICVLAGSSIVGDAWELTEGYRAAFEQLLEIARTEPPKARSMMPGASG